MKACLQGCLSFWIHSAGWKSCSYTLHVHAAMLENRHAYLYTPHTHMHIAMGLQYSLLAVPPGCSCSPRSMEKKGSEQWKAFHLTVGVGDRAQLSHTGSLSRTYTNKHTQEKQKDKKQNKTKKLFVLKSNNKGYLSQNYFSSYLKLAFFYNYFKIMKRSGNFNSGHMRNNIFSMTLTISQFLHHTLHINHRT